MPSNGGGGFEKFQYFYHPDHLGSTSYVTDQLGQVDQHYETFPFGESWIEEATGQADKVTPYRFTGKEWDSETQLHYFGARYYDPRTSLWTAMDPALGEYFNNGGLHEPVNLSLSAYVGNDPLNFVDPNGESRLKPITRPLVGLLAKVTRHRHHTTPREILKSLPTDVAKDPRVRGGKGSPNKWSIPADVHRKIHRGAGGGKYNETFKQKLKELGRDPTADDVVKIRDQMVKDFGLEKYRPDGSTPSTLSSVGSAVGAVGIGVLDFIDAVEPTQYLMSPQPDIEIDTPAGYEQTWYGGYKKVDPTAPDADFKQLYKNEWDKWMKENQPPSNQ